MWTEKDYVNFFVDEFDGYIDTPTTRDEITDVVNEYQFEVIDSSVPPYWGQCVDMLKEMEYYDWSDFDLGVENVNNMAQVTYAALCEGFGLYYDEIINALCEKYGAE